MTKKTDTHMVIKKVTPKPAADFRPLILRRLHSQMSAEIGSLVLAPSLHLKGVVSDDSRRKVTANGKQEFVAEQFKREIIN